MNPSKLFITSLLAAAAMGAVPAFAEDYTVTGAVKQKDGRPTILVPNGGTITNSGGTTVTEVTVTSSDTFTFDGATGYLPGWNGGTFAGNIVLTGNGLTINNGNSGSYMVFSGSVSGAGDFIVNAGNDPAKGQDFIFTGNLTAFTGDFSRPVANFNASGTDFYNNSNTGILQFGGTVSSDGIGTGTAYVASAVADTAGVVHNISGTNQSTITTTSVLRYNYTGSANEGVTALGIDNASISARYLDFCGGANYTVSSAVSGNNATAANNTLKISAGTTTFTGAIANFGTIVVASDATADFSNTTFKLGTVSTDSVTTTISNSGTVTFGAGTIFDVDSAASLVRGAQLLGGMSGQTQTFTIANLSVGGYLVNQRGSAAFSVSDSGVLTLDSYTPGAIYSLTWNGGDPGVWKVNGTGWTTTDTTDEVTFQNGDNVTFSTENAEITVSGTVNPATMMVSAATSLTGTGTVRVDAANLTTNAVLTLDEDVRLDLGTMTNTNNTVDLREKLAGTGTIVLAKSDGNHNNVIRLGDDFHGILEYTGRIGQQNLPNVGANTTLKLNNVWLWGTSAATINQKVIITGADGYINENSATFAGETTIEGAFDVRTGGTLNISGKTTAATLKVSGGTLNIDGDAEKTITTLTQDNGTLTVSGDGVKNITTLTQNGGTLTVSDGGVKNIAMLTQTGGTLTVSGDGVKNITTLTKGGGTLTVSGDGIKNITTLNVNGGATTTIGGSNTSITTLNVATAYGMTFSGSAIVGTFNGNKAAMFNIGEGSDATKVVSVGRLNLGNTTDTGTNTLAVKSDSVFKVTGTTNSGTNNQVSIILGRESSKTLINVQGKFLAAGATAIAGKSGFEITVENGGVFAVNGLAQYTSSNTPTMKLTLNDGGTAIFGAGGFSTLNTGTTWECSLGAGTFGTSNAGGLTISKNMTLTSATGTTFDTQLWNFASDGNDIARSADTASSITVNGVISGDGALKKSGAGTLTLNGNNAYAGGTVIEAGTVVAAHASALGTTKGVEVQSGATLNLGAPAVTVAGLSGAGSVGLADGRTSSTLTVNSAVDCTFSGSIGSAVSLVKQGTGTLELSGQNLLYSVTERAYQAVSVDGGTLRIVTNRQAMTHAGATTVASGAALEVSVSDSVSVSLTSVSISEGGKLIIDLSNYASATETFALDLITTSALQYNGEDFASDCTSLLGNAVELKGWTQTGWAESLAYDGSKLSLTMTIPEPSVFGLLAGLGALALAGKRRRRRK